MNIKMLTLKVIFGLALVAAIPSCRAAPDEAVIRSPLAGAWYPGDATALRAEIDGDLAAAATAPTKGLCAIITPHAGYRYSGKVAAHGYGEVRGGDYDRIVILGPTHQVQMRNYASVISAAAYETPLGRIGIDQDFVRRLHASALFRDVPTASVGEHSVEIQFPFLQVVLPDIKIVPIVVGQLDDATVKAMADLLRSLVDARTLVIASSDFTHFGPNYDYIPFKSNVEENLRKLDMGACAFIQQKDAKGFSDYCRDTGATICGRDAIAVLLAMLPDNSHATLLKYDTSGHLMGDFQNSVSYMSVTFSGAWTGAAPAVTSAPAAAEAELSAADKKALLALARGSLEHYLANGRIPDPKDLGITLTPAMEKIMGAFVTLQEHQDLRGCIGEIRPRRELYKAVLDHAVDAGVNDPRFRPVTTDELPHIVIEISALTPPHAVDSYTNIVLGRDGVVLYKGGASAVFLPQVAPEQHWNIDETLSHLSMKAGLEADAWKEGARFDVFQATVFSEDDR